MTSPIEFFVPGIARPGGSKKANVVRRRDGSIVTNAKGNPVVAVRDMGGERTENWRAVVALEARRVFQGEPLSVPLRLDVTFWMPRPKAHFRGNGELRDWAPHYCAKAPDTTKLLRALEDALTGIVWRDDTLIVEQAAKKIFGSRPGAQVTITPLAANVTMKPTAANDGGQLFTGATP